MNTKPTISTNGHGSPWYTAVQLQFGGVLLVHGRRTDLVSQVNSAATSSRPLVEWVALGDETSHVDIALPWRNIAFIGQEEQISEKEARGRRMTR